MAQYLPFIPDVLPEPVIYAPDFNFFDKMLQRKQLQYDQGVSRARQAYMSVHDAPLTDAANIPLRDQYLKQAQAGLKKIAASDLSLPQNQQIAESLYSPFWQDEFITKDANLTKWYRNQAQQLDSWKNSTDEKVRAQYNPLVNQYLSNGLDVLRNAGRDANNYSKVEKREAIPWTNIESYLEKAANDQKLSVKYDDPSGPYLVSTENGERSKQKYSIWAQSMIGNNFYKQFNVTGIVEKEERIKQIKNDPAFKAKYPNATDQDILTFMGDDVVSELQDGYKKRKEEVNLELTRVNSLLKSLPTVMDESQKQMFDRLSDERRQLIARMDGVDQEYKDFDQEDQDKIKKALLVSPDSYFTLLAKQRVINNWSTGRAAVEKREVKPNTAWSDAQKMEIDKARLTLDQTKAIWEREKDIWEMQHPTATTTGTTTGGTKTVKDANGNDVVVPADYTDPTTLGVYMGMGSTDITKTPGTAFQVFTKHQKDLFNGSYDMLYSTAGLLNICKMGLGLSQQDISYVSTYMSKKIRSDIYDASGSPYTASKEEMAALNKLDSALVTTEAVKKIGYNTNKSIQGPGGRTDAIIAYARQYFTDKLDDVGLGTLPLTNEEQVALSSYSTALQNLNAYRANEANKEELLKTRVLTDKAFENLVINEGGKKRMIVKDDIAKIMPTVEIHYFDDNNKPVDLKISSSELADAFFKGEIERTVQDDFYWKGNKAFITKVNDGTEHNWYTRESAYWNAFVRDKLEKKYTSSKDFSELIKKADEAIVPNLLYFQQQSGRAGVNFYYAFDTKKAGDKSMLIFNGALNPANGDIYENGEQVGTEKQEKLRRLLQDKEENVEKYLQGFTYKTLTDKDGRPAIQFSVNATGGENDPLKDIAGTYDVVLNQEMAGYLSQLPQNTGQYMYGELLRGGVVKSDPILEAAGFSYELVPNTLASSGQSADPSKVHLSLKYNLRVTEKDPKDPSGKTMITRMEPKKIEQDFDLKAGPNRKSPDEIVSYLWSLFDQVMASNKASQDQYTDYLKANSNSTITLPNGQTKPATYNKTDLLNQAGIKL